MVEFICRLISFRVKFIAVRDRGIPDLSQIPATNISKPGVRRYVLGINQPIRHAVVEAVGPAVPDPVPGLVRGLLPGLEPALRYPALTLFLEIPVMVGRRDLHLNLMSVHGSGYGRIIGLPVMDIQVVYNPSGRYRELSVKDIRYPSFGVFRAFI